MKLICLAIVSLSLLLNVASGYKKRSECVFPFNYNKKVYTDCVTEDAGAPWCSPTKEYSGLFYYCNDNQGEAYEKNTAFLLAQKKLMDNRKVLEKGVDVKGGECDKCDGNLQVTANMVHELRKLSDDNDRQINFLIDVENTKFRDVLEVNFRDVAQYLSCPNGWYPLNSRECFGIFKGLSLADSRAKCAKHNAKLASIKNINENNIIMKKGKQILGSATVLIGYTDVKHEKQWIWDDMSESKFTNWNKGEPNNIGNEDCATMYLATGKWNDIACKYKYNPVCRGDIVTLQ